MTTPRLINSRRARLPELREEQCRGREVLFLPRRAAGRSPREVRKTVTVVFTDVAGSTALGERLDPEALRAVMARYFDVMRAALERHGGTVEKFIGDAVMAVFGVPSVHEDDALRAVRAAAEMRERAGAAERRSSSARWGVALEIRTGVNTGEVVAGDASRPALVTGDAVNVAARLEQARGAGEILLGRRRPTGSCATRSRPSASEPLDGQGQGRAASPAYRLLEVVAGRPAPSRGGSTRRSSGASGELRAARGRLRARRRASGPASSSR